MDLFQFVKKRIFIVEFSVDHDEFLCWLDVENLFCTACAQLFDFIRLIMINGA